MPSCYSDSTYTIVGLVCESQQLVM